MIEQIQLSLQRPDGERIPQAWAYRLYGWLMEQLPMETAGLLHKEGSHPLSHALWYDSERQTSLWTLNLLNIELAEQIKPLLDCERIELRDAVLIPKQIAATQMDGGEAFLQTARQAPSRKAEILFRSPCAFKQAGRYAIYPQESLLLQSLVMHWNAAFPKWEVSDPDALEELLRGIHIVDYNLHTTSYALKGTRVPSFSGRVVTDAKLALPLLELWNALLAFAPYGGIGIKTTLGMGGVQVRPLTRPQLWD